MQMLSPKSFHQKITTWYDEHGRKHLPWQSNKSYYSVWLSEIMLQQTQVSTVIPYYEKFLKTFPAVQDLAKAHPDEVMSLWSGLGYYARARNLHKTAQIISQDLAGKFPETLEEMIKLPGIGRSTAGAILSLTQNRPYAIMDGNVKRVLSRYFCEAQEKILWSHAESLIQKENAANYTQAMMDLGASLCTRNQPKCSLCPLSETCKAKLTGQTDAFPVKSKVKQKDSQELFFLTFIYKHQIFLERREESGIWGGLFSFPLTEKISSEDPEEALRNLIKTKYLMAEEKDNPNRRKEKNIAAIKINAEKTHVFSHFQLRYTPVTIKLTAPLISLTKGDWYSYEKALSLGLPKPIREIIENLTKDDCK
jgi:A/G-specific adenine glycosylase